MIKDKYYYFLRLFEWIRFQLIEQIQSPVNSTQSSNSAVEKLAQALQQDQDNGDENGGENWEKAIESLSAEMGIPVDDDIEDALMEITEIHLDNISSNWNTQFFGHRCV